MLSTFNFRLMTQKACGRSTEISVLNFEKSSHLFFTRKILQLYHPVVFLRNCTLYVPHYTTLLFTKTAFSLGFQYFYMISRHFVSCQSAILHYEFFVHFGNLAIFLLFFFRPKMSQIPKANASKMFRLIL